jgi:hypothetical protein
MRVHAARHACAKEHTWHDCRLLLIWCLTFSASVIADDRALFAAPGDKALCDCLPVCNCSTVASQNDSTAESSNFVIISFVDGPKATDVAKHCESLCSQLRVSVFDLSPNERWQPKCRVVFHNSRDAYKRAVGPSGSQTVGSSTVTFLGGRVSQRRIDLLAVHLKQGLSALPHELVHILFADAFPKTPPPKWAEEGMALLFDPQDKKARHERDLDTAIRSNTTLSLDRLLADVDYPSASHRAAFYAQSLSLVDYLTRLNSPQDFVRFASLSTQHGPEHALSIVYNMDTEQLGRNWRTHATNNRRQK